MTLKQQQSKEKVLTLKAKNHSFHTKKYFLKEIFFMENSGNFLFLGKQEP